MSYGGGYNNSGVDNNNWNDRFREQSLGGRPASSSAAAPFTSDPFGANEDFGGSGEMNNVARFGRPSASNDLESDFDHDMPASSLSRRNNGSSNSGSPSRYGRGGFQSSSGSSRQQQQQQQFSSGYGDAVEPPRVSRASSSAGFQSSALGGSMPGVSSSLSRSSSTAMSRSPDGFGGSGGFNDEGGAPSSTGVGSTADALGVGVGVARMHDPYPSLRTSTSRGGSVSSSHNDHQPGATSVARRAAPSGAQKLLPPRKEATPIMPPSLAVEPAMPRPKTSRRFLHYTRLERHADLAVAKKVKNARYKAGDDDRHVLKCPNCQSFLKIPKMAVLMQCPTCSTVSPATSTAA